MGRSTRGCRAPRHKRSPKSSPKIPGTPMTVDSDCPSTPWDYDATESPYQEDNLFFLEDKFAYYITWPICRFLWRIFLYPLWISVLRPTVWDMALRPLLRILGKIPWEWICVQTLWERIIVQGLWEELPPLLLRAISLPLSALERPISALQYFWGMYFVPISVLLCIRGYRLYCSVYRDLEPVRRHILRPIVHPILRALLGAHRVALYFCTWLSFSICYASDRAYNWERGVSSLPTI